MIEDVCIGGQVTQARRLGSRRAEIDLAKVHAIMHSCVTLVTCGPRVSRLTFLLHLPARPHSRFIDVFKHARKVS